jgi:butyrate kinase
MAQGILVINPGSTSTKLALFSDGRQLFVENLALTAEEVSRFPSVMAQLEYRVAQVRSALDRHGFVPEGLAAVVGRGGLLRPLDGGIYRVGPAMLADLAAAKYGEHSSNLGAFIASDLAEPLGIQAFIADPVVVDELWELARVSGHLLFPRRSIFHALNQKAVARRCCAERGLAYGEARIIVAHMGGGVSVGLHVGGRVVDVNNGLDGEGPFSAERSGTLPAGDLARLCFSGKYRLKEVLSMIMGKGGLVSLEGTNDLRQVEKRMAEGDEAASLHFRAFAYNVAKAIGALAAAASGRVDAVVLTGGVAHSEAMTVMIGEMCNFIAPVAVYPGEGELESLAEAGMRALSGESVVFEY